MEKSSGMSAFEPVDFGTWSASPEGARIEDPLQKIRAYDDRLRKDLYREGLYTDEAEKQIVQAGADQALRAGHIADVAEYAPPIAATAPDDNFIASALIGEGNVDKASAIYRLQSFRGRADTAPETLARAEQDAALDPAEVNRLTKAAVRTGKLPFAVVQNDKGEQILEVDPELGALSREELLDLADTVPGGVDPRVLPMLEKQFTRAPGSNYTPAQARQESIFDKFISEKKKTDDFLTGQIDDAISEYNRAGAVSTETREALDRTLTALDADNEFSPASRTRYLDDMIKRAANPEAYDPENPQQHVQYLNDGSVWLPDQVVFNEADYKGTLDKLTGITPEQKEAAIAQREARLEAVAPQYVDAMGADPDALDFYTKSKAEGKTDSQIATEWYGDKTKYSAAANRLRSTGMGFADATKGFVESIQAMAFDDKEAMASLVARRENMARNEEYARLSGDSYGIGQSALNTAPQVIADILLTGAVSAVATPAAGAAVLGIRTAGMSAVRSLARSTITAGTKSTLKTFIRGGAVRAATAMATLGDDLVKKMALEVGPQKAVGAAVSRMAGSVGTTSALASTTFARAAGSSYVSTYSALDAQTLPNGTPRYTDEEKRKIALSTATISGISTAAITLGFGSILGPGVEGLVSGKLGTKALKGVFGMTDETIVAASRSSALTILKSAGAEAPEEAVDQLLSGVYEKIATGEEFRLGPALKEALEAGAVGGLLGAGAGAIQALATKPRDPAVAKLEAAGAPLTAAAVEAQAAPTATPATAAVDPVADLRDAATEVGARVAELSAQLTELKADPEKNKGRIVRVNKRLAEAKAEKTRIDFAIKNPDTIRMPGGDEQRIVFEPTTLVEGEVPPAAAPSSVHAVLDAAIDEQTELAAARLTAAGRSDTLFRDTASKTKKGSLAAKFKWALSHKYDQLRSAKDGEYDMYSVSDQDASSAGVSSGAITAKPEGGWFYRGPKSLFSKSGWSGKKGDTKFSANVTFAPALISGLDAFMLKLQARGADAYYKTPDQAVNWGMRHDPVSIYSSDALTDAEQQELASILAPHTRTGSKSLNSLSGRKVADGVYEDANPSKAQLDALEDRAEKLGGAELRAVVAAKTKGKVSTGEVHAIGALLDSMQQTPAPAAAPAAATTASAATPAPDRRTRALSRVLVNRGVSDAVAIRFAAAMSRTLPTDTTLEQARDQIITAFKEAGGRFADEQEATASVRTNPETWIAAGYTPEEAATFADIAAQEAEAAVAEADAVNETIEFPEPIAVEQLDPENFIAEFRAERPDSGESDAEIKARQARMISTAILGRDADGRGPRPVSAAAVRAYGIDVPAGWTETGGLLVPPTVPTATSGVTITEPMFVDDRDAMLRDGVPIKKGEPGYVAPQDRPFAAQKFALLPEEATLLVGQSLPTPTPAAQERASTEVDKLAAAGHVPTHNDFMARFKVNAAKASAMRKELTAAIRALYPLVVPPASATMKTAKVLGLNDLKAGKNAVQVPIFDERTAPFTNDPHTTALQLSAGRSVAVPAGVSLNPSIFLSPDGKHVSASTANTGQVIYGSGQYSRPSYVRAAYVPTKNKPKYMASVSTLPTAAFSTLPSRVVTYAKSEIDPSKTTEADLIAYFFGSDEKVKRMVRSKSSGLSDTELESITNSVQFAFLREIREFFLSPSDVPATIDPKGFGKTTESYKKYLAERARHFLGANPENYWSDKGAPASPFYFVEGEIKNAAQGARSRPKEAVGDDQVTTDDIIDRAASRAAEEDAADAIELFQEDWLEGAVEGTGILIGAEGVPTPDAAADIAARFIRAMGSNPQLRSAFNALIVNASSYPLGNPKRISYAATIRAMDTADVFMLGASAVFIRPELMQNVDFRAMMAPAVNAFPDRAPRIESPAVDVESEVLEVLETRLTPEEKTRVAGLLGHDSWTPEAAKDTSKALADWRVSNKSVSTAIAAFFESVWQKLRTGALSLMAMVSLAPSTVEQADGSWVSVAEIVAESPLMGPAAPGVELPDWSNVKLSDDTRIMASWVLGKNDAKGMNFVIADKVSAEVHIFRGDGELIYSTPGLFGFATGSDTTTAEQDRMTVPQLIADKTSHVTPAGKFVSKMRPNPTYGEALVFGEGTHAVAAFHEISLAIPAQKRGARLASETAADNSISMGCINLSKESMAALSKASQDPVAIYVMPSTEAGRSLFDGFGSLPSRPSTPAAKAARGRMDSRAYLDQASIPTIREDNAAAAADLQLDGDLRSALERIVRSAKFPRRYRAIAKAALQMQTLPSLHMVDSPTAAYAGFYSGSSNSIHLNMASSNGRGLLDVLMHEMLHAATAEIVRNPRTAKERALRDRLERYRIAVAGNVPSDMSYAVSSLDEFITHCATDPRFQRIARETIDRGRSVWDKIVEAIASFFGITNRGFVSDLWGFINHGAEYTNRAETLRTPVTLESQAVTPEVAPSRRALPDPTEVESRTVAGKTVGTRSPKAKGVKGTGVNQELRIDLASARLDPKLYKKNAFLLSSYAVVAKEFPEIAARSATATKALETHDALIESKRADVARLGAALTKSIKESRAARGKPLKGKAGQGAAMTAIMEKESGPLAAEWRATKKKLKQLVAARPEVAKKTTAKIDEAAANLTMEEADALYEGLKTATRDNLKALIDLFPARLRDVAKLWYDGANIIAQGFAKSYNLSLEQTSAVIAVFSPQKDWFMNVAIAKRTMDIWTNHQNTPFSDAMAKNFLDRAGQPQFVYDKKGEQQFSDPETKLVPKYTGGAVPILNETGTAIVGWSNWSAEKAAKSVEDARLELVVMRGKTLAQLEGRHQAVFIRMHEEVNNPGRGFPIISPDGNFGGNKQTEPDKNGQTRDQKLGWGSYVTIDKAIAIMTAPKASEMQVISDALGEQHKVRSFYNNIVDPQSKDGHVTMDTHAIAALLWQALSGASRAVTQNFGGAGTASSGILGVNGLYPAFAEAYRALAAELEMLPRQVQSITWEAIRILFPAKWKSQKSNVAKVDKVWQDYRDGTITADDARTRIFELTNPRATGGARSVAEPDWTQIFFSGADPAGSQEADDQGVLPADRESIMGSGRGAVGSGMDRDVAGLPDGAAGRGGVDTRFAQSPTTGTATTDTLDRYLPQPPAGMSYEFEGTRGKYLAYVSRSAPNTITINRAGLNALIEGLDPANARAIVRKIVNHEIAHHAAFSAFTTAEIAEMASRLTGADVMNIANRYYAGATDSMARMEEDIASGVVSNDALVEEWLRMQAEIIVDGGTTEEVLAFHRKNPGMVSRVLEYIRRFVASLWARTAGPQEDFATRVEISRMMREYRNIKRGWRSEQPVPFSTDDVTRDSRLMALDPANPKDPDEALREAYEPLVLDWSKPYEEGSVWKRMLVDRFGDRRLSSLTERRNQQLITSSKTAQRGVEALKRAMKKEQPPTDLVSAAMGSTDPNISAEQWAVIDAEFDAAMEEAGQLESPEEQAAAAQEAFAMKDAMKRAAVVETTAALKRARNAALEELDKIAPETAKAARAARKATDTISSVIKEFFPEGSYIRHVFDQTGGIYLTRSYKLHHKDGDPLEILQDPEKAEAVESAKKELLKWWLEAEAEKIMEEAAASSRYVSPEEALAAAQKLAEDQDIGLSLVEDYLLSHGTKAFYHGGPNFKADLTRLMAKKDVPEALRSLMEEITDPVENALRTTLNVGMLAASMRFTKDLAEGGFRSGALVTRTQQQAFPMLVREKDDEKFLQLALNVRFARLDEKPGYIQAGEIEGQPVFIPGWLAKAREERDITMLEGFRSIGKNSKKYGVGELSDLLANPVVADVLDSMFERNKMPTTAAEKAIFQAGGLLAGATGLSLGVATLGSVGFYARNMVGAGIGLLTNGINPASADGLRAVQVARDSFMNSESGWVTKLSALGVLHDDTRPETIKELLKSETDRPGGLNMFEWLGKIIAKEAGKNVGTKITEKASRLADFASAIDGYAKTVAFFHELRTLQEAYPGMAQAEQEQKAAEAVKRTFQAKSQTVPIVDAFTTSSFGRLFASFARFKSEMIRLVAEIPLTASNEMKSDNPVIRSRGKARMTGFVSAMTFAIAGPAVLSALMGVGDDEERALRASLPSYLKGNSILYAKSKDGRSIISYDITYANQWSMIGDPISRMGRAFMRGEPGEGAEELTLWLKSQWLEEQIAFGAAMEVLRNRTSDDKKIFLETDDLGDRVTKLSAHLVGSSFTPQSGKVLYRAYEAARRGVPEDANLFDQPGGILLGHALPVRPRSFLTEDMALRAYRAAAETNRDVRSIAGQFKKRQNLDGSDLEGIADDLYDSSVSLSEHMASLARGYESLGLTKPQVVREMVKAGFSQEKAKGIVFSGIVKAPSITPATRAQIIEAGDDAGGAGGGVKRLQEIQKALRARPGIINVREPGD